MQSYCIFCIYTTFYTIKAYIITIKNKLMNKTPYRYTTKLLSRTIGGSVGMAGCHTLLIKDCLVGALETSAPPGRMPYHLRTQKKVSKVV